MGRAERFASLRAAWAARRLRWSSAGASLRSRARREREAMALGARRAAACLALSSACVAAWLLGVWGMGRAFVHEAPHGAAPGAPPGKPAERPGAGARSSEGVGVEPPATGAAIERVAGLDLEEPAPHPLRPYPLDGRSRAAGSGPLPCPVVELTEHAGDGIAFAPPARVAPPFRERLRELERVLREVSLPFYGRAPSALLVAASYDCRSINGRSERLSEHALGNAIDITGFRFDRLDAASAPAFEVRVDRHWKARGDATRELHARFLDALTKALIARDVFRTLLGPAHRDHADHFHFDMAPHDHVEL